MSVAGIALAILVPLVAFLLTLALIGFAALRVYLFWRAGRHLWGLLSAPSAPAAGARP